MRDWRFELQVLDGSAANELTFLLEYKVSAITALASVVEAGRVPLRTEGLLIDDGGTLRVPVDSPSDRQFRLGQLKRTLGEQMMDVPVRADQPWDAEILPVVERYLAERRPREQLEAIRVALEKIRAALEANFSVSDILLRAGDPRARRAFKSDL